MAEKEYTLSSSEMDRLISKSAHAGAKRLWLIWACMMKTQQPISGEVRNILDGYRIAKRAF